jgi:hypothetical protein
MIVSAECGYWREPKMTRRPHEGSQMRTIFTHIARNHVFLYMFMSAFLLEWTFFIYVFYLTGLQYGRNPKIQKEIAPKNIGMTPSKLDILLFNKTEARYSFYTFGWISMWTACRLGFCPVYRHEILYLRNYVNYEKKKIF